MHRLSRVLAPVGAPALFLCEVLLISCCFLVVTFLILNVDPVVFLLADNGLLRIALAVASILFGLYFEDLYSRVAVKSRVLLIQQLCLVMGMALLIQGFISYVDSGLRLPLRLMFPAIAALIVALFGWRLAYGAFVLRVVGAQRILFVGLCPMLEDVARHIGAHAELGLEVIGYIDDDDARSAPQGAGKRLGPLTALPAIATEVRPDLIVVGFADRPVEMPTADLLQLRYGGMAIEEAAVAYEQLFGRVLLSELYPSEVLLSSAFQPRPQRVVYQTLAHWFLALLLAVLTAPLLLLTALLLKLSSRGPLLESTECVGLGGRPFRLHRFRLPNVLHRVQRFVTRWRLDALPELWNVLRGDMWFVGPRAASSEHANALSRQTPFYRQRQRVKPGITGWAQINTPAEQPEDPVRRLEYDFYYIKNSSSGLDAYILVRTLRDLLFSPPADALPAGVSAWHTNS